MGFSTLCNKLLLEKTGTAQGFFADLFSASDPQSALRFLEEALGTTDEDARLAMELHFASCVAEVLCRGCRMLGNTTSRRGRLAAEKRHARPPEAAAKPAREVLLPQNIFRAVHRLVRCSELKPPPDDNLCKWLLQQMRQASASVFDDISPDRIVEATIAVRLRWEIIDVQELLKAMEIRLDDLDLVHWCTDPLDAATRWAAARTLADVAEVLLVILRVQLQLNPPMVTVVRVALRHFCDELEAGDDAAECSQDNLIADALDDPSGLMAKLQKYDAEVMEQYAGQAVQRGLWMSGVSFEDAERVQELVTSLGETSVTDFQARLTELERPQDVQSIIELMAKSYGIQLGQAFLFFLRRRCLPLADLITDVMVFERYLREARVPGEPGLLPLGLANDAANPNWHLHHVSLHQFGGWSALLEHGKKHNKGEQEHER